MPGAVSPSSPREDTDPFSRGGPCPVLCPSFCAGFRSRGPTRAGGPGTSGYPGCEAGAAEPVPCRRPGSGAGCTPPSAPVGPDQTPVPVRRQTTFLSCQFSRLSAEPLLVSERKQRGGTRAARQGSQSARWGSHGRPEAGSAGRSPVLGVLGLRSDSPGASSPQAHSPPLSNLLTFSSLAPSPPNPVLPFSPKSFSCHTDRVCGFV